MSSPLSHACEFEAFHLNNNCYFNSSISITIKAHSYQEGLGLFQTGGADGVADVDTVDFSPDGETWEMLPTKIPDGLYKQNSWFDYKMMHKKHFQGLVMAIARYHWIGILS